MSKYSKTSQQFRFSTSRDILDRLDGIAKDEGVSLTKLINDTLKELIIAKEIGVEGRHTKN